MAQTHSNAQQTQAASDEHTSLGQQASVPPAHITRIRWAGFAGGLVLAAIIYLAMPADVPREAHVTAATAALMGVWWMTEAIPIPATSLLPLVIFPVFNGVDISDVGGKYGADVIFLFMGGFLIALAVQRWNLHRRIALIVVRIMGDRTSFMIAGFMIATGFLSMWISNTATAVLMLPIGLSVLLLVNERIAATGDNDAGLVDVASKVATRKPPHAQSGPRSATEEALLQTNFGAALMLAIAYAASIGSLSTIIGTPPNTFLVGYLRDSQGISIGFGQWMLAGVPISLAMMVITWALLTKVLFRPEIKHIPGGRELISSELAKLGATSRGEWRVLTVFALTALAWIIIPSVFDPAPISDAGIAMLAGLVLFILPCGEKPGVRLLDWDSAVQMPWGVLLLFGGGLALSAQFTDSGLTEWIGETAKVLGAAPSVVIVAALATVIIFLTELTSNTATAATFIPVAAGVAGGIGIDPLLATVPVALAASCAFMLPVATPPNAVAYGSGYVSIGQMMKGGVWLNLIGVALITAATMSLIVWVFGITY